MEPVTFPRVPYELKPGGVYVLAVNKFDVSMPDLAAEVARLWDTHQIDIVVIQVRGNPTCHVQFIPAGKPPAEA